MIIRGKIYWAKILGKAPTSEFGTFWSFDFVPEDGGEELLKAGMKKDYLKEDKNNDHGGVYLSFKRNAIKKDGSPAKTFQVVGPDGEDWDQMRLIGNGSVVNVKIALNETSYKKQTWLKPSAVAIQVWDHIKYQGKNDFKIKGQEVEGNNNW